MDAKRCDRGGDCQCLCDAVKAYAQICLEVGVCVDWRSETNCRKYCVCLSVCLSVGVSVCLSVCLSVCSQSLPVAYPGWHTPGVQTEDGVLAPPGKLNFGAPRQRCWMGEGGSMLKVIISFSDNVIGIRLLKIALTLN